MENPEIIATSIARPGPTARPKSDGKPQILTVKNENILSKMDTKIDELSGVSAGLARPGF